MIGVEGGILSPMVLLPLCDSIGGVRVVTDEACRLGENAGRLLLL
jgi:hypothetical protein